MRLLARRRYFCGTREGSVEYMKIIIFIDRLFVKSNVLYRYNDNELVSRHRIVSLANLSVHAHSMF